MLETSEGCFAPPPHSTLRNDANLSTVLLESQPISHFRENFETFCNFSIKMCIFSNIYLCLSDK